MDGLQVANDSEKILGSRVAPNRPYVESSPGLEPAAGHEHAPTTANPAGLKPLTFGLLVAAVTCILTAGIVGGVTGGVLGHKTSKITPSSSCVPTTVVSTATVSASASTSAPTSSSPIVNNYAPVSYNDVNTTAFPFCPGQNGQTITSPKYNKIYSLQCYVNLQGTDILSIIAYSLEDCIQACTNLNECVAVNFWAVMSEKFDSAGGNCWLKQTWESTSQDSFPLHVGAVLQV